MQGRGVEDLHLSNKVDRDQHSDLTTGVRCITDLAVNYWRSCVLFAANKLDIFSAIGARSVTAAELSTQLSLDARGCQKLLDGCVSIGLLDKSDSKYSLTEDSRLFLDRRSANSLADWVSHWADMLSKGSWQKLAESVQLGGPVVPESKPFRFDRRRDPLINWVGGMHQAALAGHANVLTEIPEFDSARSLLDVGAGPGTYSIELCRRFPDLRVTILDTPEMHDVAQQYIAAAGLTDRIHFESGDFRLDSTTDREFDVVLLSNVLHMCDVAGAMDMLRNAARHLSDGGLLVVQEWIIDSTGTQPHLSALFNLHLLINPNGDLFREDELRRMLDQTGFDFSETIATGGIYDVMLARKRGRSS